MRQGDGQCWEIVRRYEFNLVPNRLCLLFGLDENMSTCGTSLRGLCIQRDTKRF